MFGAAAGAVAGFLTPRSGEETQRFGCRYFVNDAWDSALDSYERTSKVVSTKIDEVKPAVDARTVSSAQRLILLASAWINFVVAF